MRIKCVPRPAAQRILAAVPGKTLYWLHSNAAGSCVETAYKIALVVMLFVVIFNLGQALYFMLTERKRSSRTVWALTRRIALSFVLIGMVVLGIWMGWLSPHGIGH